MTSFLKGWRQTPVIKRCFARRGRVSVIRLSGMIADNARVRSSLSIARLAPVIEKAFDRADTAVALVINSPGGSPAQSALIAARIRQHAEEAKLPVYAFVEDAAASGGYWLACAADEIYAQEVSVVGSIGVIYAGFGFQDLIDRYGVERRLHASGAEKSFLDPFRPEREADVARLHILQKDIHAAFISWVKERRGARLKGADGSLFEGQFWTGAAARDNGAIDGIGEVRAVMREKFGKDVKLSEFTAEKKLFSCLPFLPPRGSLSADLAETLEAKGMWARYGL